MKISKSLLLRFLNELPDAVELRPAHNGLDVLLDGNMIAFIDFVELRLYKFEP